MSLETSPDVTQGIHVALLEDKNAFFAMSFLLRLDAFLVNKRLWISELLLIQIRRAKRNSKIWSSVINSSICSN